MRVNTVTVSKSWARIRAGRDIISANLHLTTRVNDFKFRSRAADQIGTSLFIQPSHYMMIDSGDNDIENDPDRGYDIVNFVFRLSSFVFRIFILYHISYHIYC